MVAIKRRAKAKWQKTHAPDDRRLYNNASNKLKTALPNLSNDSFTKYDSTLRRDDYSIYKPIKARKKPQTPLPPIRKNTTPPGPWAKSNTEKVELFANHLAEVFTPHDNSPNPEVEREIAAYTQPTEKIQAFTHQELTLVIKKLHPHRAPGFDLISAQMLQEMPHEGYQTLLYIFNAICRLQYWPAPLKQAKIIMSQKPGKTPTDVASYKPISLLPILSKILEKLLKRICRDTNLQECIPSHQFGSRKAHSTIQQCHRIIDTINKAFEEHKYCSAVFLDVSQAFDKV